MDKSLVMLLSVVRRRSLPAVATLVSAIATGIAYLVVTPPVYEVAGRLILDKKEVSVSELGRNLSQLTNHTPGGASPLATQAEVMKSPGLLTAALEQVESEPQLIGNGSLPSLNQFKRGLKVKLIPATNILELTYQHEDPEIAANLLNSLLEISIEKSREAIRLEAKSIREFLENELPEQQAKAEAAEFALNQYREDSGLVAVDEQTRSLLGIISSIQQEESSTAAQLEEMQQRLETLKEIGRFNNTEDAYAGSRIGQDENLRRLRDRLNEIDGNLVQAQSRFTNQHPVVQALVQQRDEVRSAYELESQRIPNSQGGRLTEAEQSTDPLSQDITSQFLLAQTNRNGLEYKLQVLRAQRISMQNQLDRLPIKEQQLAALTRARDEAIESLKFLNNKLAEARIAEAQLVSNLRIMEAGTVPLLPAGPSKTVVLVLAIAAGGVMGISLMLLLELLDPQIHDSWEVEGLLDLPLLGILPDLSPEAMVLKNPEPFLNNFKLVEPYRLLLKTLEFRTQNNLRPIVVSSTVAGEGKSVVAAHLGAVSAMLSRRTLIIDADLHQPSQHLLLGVPAEPGLTDTLTRPVTLLEMVQPTAIKNLWVLSCGAGTANPAMFLESPAMQSLLREAAALYDVTIVDTPPLVDCADAHTLSQYSQGLVAVVRPKYTQKALLTESLAYLKANGVPILGFAIDSMSAKTENSYRKVVAGSEAKALPVSIRTGKDLQLAPRKPVSSKLLAQLGSKGVDNGKS